MLPAEAPLQSSLTLTVTDLPVAGTAVQLPATHDGAGYLLLQGHPNNTGDVYVGTSTVTNAAGALCGIRLTPGGESLVLRLDNGDKAWAVGDVNGDDIIVLGN